MREIKYRGMTQSRKWLYGIPVKTWWYGTYTWRIIEDGDIYPGDLENIYDESIIPETVGQYINKKDVNGKEIFKDDKLKYQNSPIYIVVWQDSGWMMSGRKNGNGFVVKIPDFIEIIGNIHEVTP